MIYLLISAFLDILLSFNIPLNFGDINYFFPALFISSIPISYLLIKRKSLFFTLIILISIIYDTLFSDIIFINVYYVVLYGLFLNVFYKNKKGSYLNIFLISIMGVIFYDIFIFFTLILLKYETFKIGFLGYKISKTLLLNSIYIILSIIIFRSRIFREKRKRKKFYYK